MRDIASELHFVGYDNHGQSFLSQVLHDFKDFTDHFWIQSRCWLIKEDGIRIHGEGTGDGYTLLLASRELFWFGLPIAFTHANFFKIFFGNFFSFRAFFFKDSRLGDNSVFENIEVFKEVEGLKNHTEFFTIVSKVIAFCKDVFSSVENFPLSRCFK